MFLGHSSSNHVQRQHEFAQLIYQSYLQGFAPKSYEFLSKCSAAIAIIGLLGTTTCTTHWLVNHVLCIWKHEAFCLLLQLDAMTVPMDAAIPITIVWTSALIKFMVSTIAKPAETDPPGVLT